MNIPIFRSVPALRNKNSSWHQLLQSQTQASRCTESHPEHWSSVHDVCANLFSIIYYPSIISVPKMFLLCVANCLSLG